MRPFLPIGKLLTATLTAITLGHTRSSPLQRLHRLHSLTQNSQPTPASNAINRPRPHAHLQRLDPRVVCGGAHRFRVSDEHVTNFGFTELTHHALLFVFVVEDPPQLQEIRKVRDQTTKKKKELCEALGLVPALALCRGPRRRKWSVRRESGCAPFEHLWVS